MERSGGDVLLLNDQTYPSQTTEKPSTTTPEDLLGKLKAAKDSLENPKTQVWVKLEGFSNYGLKGAIKRIQYLNRVKADTIVIDHYNMKQLIQLTKASLQVPLLATWQTNIDRINGISGWLDKGYLSNAIDKAQNKAINFIKQEEFGYVKKRTNEKSI